MLWVIRVELPSGQLEAETLLESRGWAGAKAQSGGDPRRSRDRRSQEAQGASRSREFLALRAV